MQEKVIAIIKQYRMDSKAPWRIHQNTDLGRCLFLLYQTINLGSKKNQFKNYRLASRLTLVSNKPKPDYF